MVQKIIDPNFHIKTFSVKCDNKLSPLAKTIFQSFKYKLYYYVIDDLLYLLKSKPDERDYLLQILNSSVIFTAPVAGTYWYGYVGMSHNNTNNFKVELLKNGSLNGNDTRAFTHDVAYSQNSIFGFITLSANDYLEFKLQNVTLHSNYGQISIKLVA